MESNRSPRQREGILDARSRVELLRALQRSPHPLDAREIAARIGLHPNTVRHHLDQLVTGGLVARHVERQGRPGRPRIVHETVEGGHAHEGDDGYEHLAEILLEQLARMTEDPAAAAEQAGRAWAVARLTGRPASRQPMSPIDTARRVTRFFADLGFAPELEDGAGPATRILLRRCPFATLARARPDIVCSIHLGLLRGALEQLEAAPTGGRLEPFVAPNLCAAHLAQAN